MNSCERVDEEEEVEERLEEAGEEDHPRPAVDHDVALDDQQAADRRPRRARSGVRVRRARVIRRRASAGTCIRASDEPDRRRTRARYARCTRSLRATTSPSVRSRQSVTPCQSGVSHAMTSSGAGQARDREERPREEEHREDHEPEDRDERDLGLACAPPRRRSAPRTTSPTSTVTGIASTPSGELDRAERGDHDEVDRRGQEEPEREERLVAEHDVAHAQRRREHRVVLAVPLDRGEHGPARLERRELHRRRRHEARARRTRGTRSRPGGPSSGRRRRRARRRARGGRRPASRRSSRRSRARRACTA